MSGSNFVREIRVKAAKKFLKIAFPDAEDIRTIKTSRTIIEEKIGVPILVGNPENIKKIAAENNVKIDDIQVINPLTSAWKEEFANHVYERRKAKGLTLEQASELVKNPLYFAGCML
ncbi:MAG: phosphate acyltransferase, partial [Candidatus Saccharicenans sp.]|nr:phosphate acyltransferase [Candidatus Saccharicenans sp.]